METLESITGKFNPKDYNLTIALEGVFSYRYTLEKNKEKICSGTISFLPYLFFVEKRILRKRLSKETNLPINVIKKIVDRKYNSSEAREYF